MNTYLEITMAFFIAVGGIFTFVGSFGLLRLPDFSMRLHSPTKATTLGVGALLVASIIYFYSQQGKLSINELLITLFLFLTAPTSAHFMARAYLHQHRHERKNVLPKLPHQEPWSFTASTIAEVPEESGKAADA